MIRCRTLCVILGVFSLGAGPATKPSKPIAAFFPLAGNASEKTREQANISMMLKLERTGEYQVIDRPKMAEVAAESPKPIAYDTPSKDIAELAKLVDANVAVWGEVSTANGGYTLKIHIVRPDDPDAKPIDLAEQVGAPTDLRFAAERLLEKLPNIKEFSHPIDQSVWNDELADKMWKEGKNLVVNGDFSEKGHWNGIYMAEKYPIEISDQMPKVDKVGIYRFKEGGEAKQILAMNLSKTCAENNGLACLSDAIIIKPETRYRLQFKYKSDGPKLHIFVKGYVMAKNTKGVVEEQEIYRRQVPPSEKTDGQWVTITDDFNPQHRSLTVEYIRIDLYTYLHPGTVLFDDIIIKPVGAGVKREEGALPPQK